MNKKDQKRFDNLKKHLGITTIAEEVVLNHLFKRDKKDILVIRFGDIKEYTLPDSKWVKITTVTNKHSFNFSALASRLEVGDESELYHKIN